MDKTVGFAVLVMMLTAALPLLAQDKPILAVMEIEDETGKFSDNQIQQAAKYLRAKLEVAGTFMVVPKSRQDKALIRELRKESYKDCYAEQCQIELGKELAADTILKSRVTEFAGTCTLSSAMVSLGSAASVGGASADFDCSEKGLKGALHRVLEKVLGGKGEAGKQDKPGGEISGSGTAVDYVPPSGEDVVISVTSEPVGAKVKAGGITFCRSTPCDGLEMAAGTHVFEFSKDRYQTERKTVEVKRGIPPVSASLKALFGWLSVTSKPSDVPVLLDDQHVGKTPVHGLEVNPGRHKVLVGDETFVEQWKEFDLAEEERKSYEFELAPRRGGLKVKARDSEGKALEGKVFVDGQEVGVTGRAFAARIGKHEVEVRTNKGVGKGTAEVAEGGTLQVILKIEAVEVSAGSGEAAITWVYSKPAILQFAKTETTVAQYRACVESGGCKLNNHRTSSEHGYCNWGHSNRDDHPMNCVKWYGAYQFCRWVGGRLPTEDEWYAESSDGGSRKYPWGSQSPDCRRCVKHEVTRGCGKDRTWPVCSKTYGNSVSGLCDMSGNVWEWTSSKWDGPKGGRVVRGGGFGSGLADDVSSSFRYGGRPDVWPSYVGFRCVLQSP